MKKSQIFGIALLACITAFASGCNDHKKHDHDNPPHPGAPGEHHHPGEDNPQGNDPDRHTPDSNDPKQSQSYNSSALSDNQKGQVNLAVNYKTYSNDKLGYTAQYPNLFVKSSELSAGDGVMLQSMSGRESMKIWATQNLPIGNMQAQLKKAEAAAEQDGRNQIVNTLADSQSFCLAYDTQQGNALIENVEFKTLNAGKTIAFEISYPENERDSFIPLIEHMAFGLRR